jgi:Transglutaminase-like superfamily/Domain of Unknown Function with PDB structure (DUF3857)
MKKIAVYISLLLAPAIALCQKQDKNITIENVIEEYRFVKGNKDNPVQIKQEIVTTYFCNEYRTDIPVVDFFNNQTVINDVNIKVNGNKIKGFEPSTSSYTVDGIFYSDAKICYFTLPLEKKGSKSETKFEKTVLDPRYFTTIFFTEPFFTQHKEVSIIVPFWMKIQIKEYNFDGYKISKQVTKKGEDEVYTYTMNNIPAMEQEEDAPGPTYIIPHLLVMSKYAEFDGNKITYFNTLADQYAWYRQLVNQIGNEPTALKIKAQELTKNITGDFEKVKTIYQWVQDNIRYIAYEDGIAGFKPEKAQEVLRKKYGDCKGMANLLAEMLKSMGYDARLCWLGTNHIAYDYSTPSLCVDNHMICVWIYKGKTYFLDGTEKYTGFGEVAERIQGRQVLIEDGDKYLLQQIPIASYLQNTAYEKRILTINGNDLTGKVLQTWKGENKEWLLHQLDQIKKEKLEDALKRFLANGNNNYQVNDLKIINLNNYNEDLKIEYELLYKNAAATFDTETYLSLDERKDFSGLSIDTAGRKFPFVFPYKDNRIIEIELQLPANAKSPALPAPLKIEYPEYSITGNYTINKNKVNYRREIIIKKTVLEKTFFGRWNAGIIKLNEFYNNQLTIIE